MLYAGPTLHKNALCLLSIAAMLCDGTHHVNASCKNQTESLAVALYGKHCNALLLAHYSSVL
jgi:hypothetical protein